LLIPGLLQTADYARAILAADPETTEDQLDDLIAARLERQAILDKPNPPALWVVLDEAVLHRLIGTRKTMYDQLLALADTSCRSNITMQIVPPRSVRTQACWAPSSSRASTTHRIPCTWSHPTKGRRLRCRPWSGGFR
jgi:uncharacterized protein DUF5753